MTDVAKEFHLAEMLDFCRNNKIVIQPVVGVTNKMLYGDCKLLFNKVTYNYCGSLNAMNCTFEDCPLPHSLPLSLTLSSHSDSRSW